jgi:hypothetical protein
MCLGDISVRSLAAHSTSVAPIERHDVRRLLLDCPDRQTSAHRAQWNGRIPTCNGIAPKGNGGLPSRAANLQCISDASPSPRRPQRARSGLNSRHEPPSLPPPGGFALAIARQRTWHEQSKFRPPIARQTQAVSIMDVCGGKKRSTNIRFGNN